ncbi:hypothetical protein HGI30_15150 [Paenibacillus albicereus]|uniref:DUF4064 domain-containing protein n=1 Tax=Paenibacillus albicereus TaxID=2726185 RepID=A0A6H2GZJ9_9BACL|nr:hypothetical protein [Paenibacillus albicereus]QJC52769.1 hypothetical protein HGI30_15150 [Paenibacillus albicereus]
MFILGLVGGLLGILFGVIAVALGVAQTSAGNDNLLAAYGLFASVSSIPAVIGCAVCKTRPRTAAVLYLCSVVAGVCSAFIYYLIPAILLIAGSLFGLKKKSVSSLNSGEG